MLHIRNESDIYLYETKQIRELALLGIWVGGFMIGVNLWRMGRKSLSGVVWFLSVAALMGALWGLERINDSVIGGRQTVILVLIYWRATAICAYLMAEGITPIQEAYLEAYSKVNCEPEPFVQWRFGILGVAVMLVLVAISFVVYMRLH